MLFTLTVCALLATAGCCLRSINTRSVTAPGVEQLRGNWRGWLQGERAGKTHTDIAETFLLAKEPQRSSVLNDALKEADSRGDWFNRAVWAMLVAMASLAVLIALVYARLF